MAKFTEYNYLSGAETDFYNYLLFEAFLSEKTYLGFARHDIPWGQCALIKVRFQPNIFLNYPQSMIGYEHTADYSSKYYDDNSYRVFSNPTQDIPAGGKRLFIARIRKDETDVENIDKYEFLDENEIGQIYIHYINDGWILVEGLNPTFYFKDKDTYNYYVFNFNKTIETRGLIEEIRFDSYSGLTIPVKLAYSLTDRYKPSTIVECGSLQRTVNTLGETYISGLDPNFEPDMNIFKNAWFFIIDSNGVVIQDGLRFYDILEDDEEKALVFEYATITGAIAKLTITTKTKDYEEICLWNESVPLPYLSTPIADNNPPGFQVTYLKQPMVSKSIFDIRGISKIKKEEVSFCKQVKNEEEENLYSSYGIEIQTIQVVQNINETIEVKFAVTKNLELALEFGFDSVMIDKELPNNVPTEDVYRQLFVCFMPKDKDGNVCTEDSYNSDDLFQTENYYGYDPGVVMYIANKVPVYRKYIDGTETFKIII